MPEISTVRPIRVDRSWWIPRVGGPVLDHLSEYAETNKVLQIKYGAKTRCRSIVNWDALLVTFNGIGVPNEEFYWFPWPHWAQGKDATVSNHIPREEWLGADAEFQATQLWKRVKRADVGLKQAERGLARTEKRQLIEYAVLGDMPEGMFRALWDIRCVLRT